MPRTGSRRRSAAYLPRPHRGGDALDLDGAEIAILEEIADQPARARGDDHRIRLGQGLEAGGEVRRLADDIVLDNLAAHDKPDR